MMTTIAISIERILQSVYAMSALDHFNARHRPVLGTDHRKALRRMVLDCTAQIVYRMTPPAVETNILDEDDEQDVITIDLELRSQPDWLPALRSTLENVLINKVYGTLWTGFDVNFANRYNKLADDALDRVATLLASVEKPPRIEAGM